MRSEVCVSCDGCQRDHPDYYNAKPGYGGTFKARASARDSGWHVGRGARDICPYCWDSGVR